MEPPNLGPPRGEHTLVLVAILGGAARQAHQWLDGRKVTWRHFVMRLIISGFIGTVCGFAFPIDSPWSYAACGLMSWLGADGIVMLVNLVLKSNSGKPKK